MSIVWLSIGISQKWSIDLMVEIHYIFDFRWEQKLGHTTEVASVFSQVRYYRESFLDPGEKILGKQSSRKLFEVTSQ